MTDIIAHRGQRCCRPRVLDIHGKRHMIRIVCINWHVALAKSHLQWYRYEIHTQYIISAFCSSVEIRKKKRHEDPPVNMTTSTSVSIGLVRIMRCVVRPKFLRFDLRLSLVTFECVAATTWLRCSHEFMGYDEKFYRHAWSFADKY